MQIKFIPTIATQERIDIADVTEESLVGRGIFDILSSTLRIHLDREMSLTRIQGKEYSEIYMKLWLPLLQEALRFTLEKEKQPFELDLLAAQADKVRKETELLGWQIEIAKLELEIKKVQLEIAKSELEIKKIELLIKLKELELAEAQVGLIKAKTLTELAQTDGSYIKPDSMLYTNRALLNKQADGFDRDAEQKATQLLLQTWITRCNNDGALTNNANLLVDRVIGTSVVALLKGAGISQNPSEFGYDSSAGKDNITPEEERKKRST